MAEASELFQRVITSMGGPVHTCDGCGVTYFVVDDFIDYEDGEIASLRESAEKEPDKYREVDYSIEHGWINGQSLVSWCECGHLKRIEDWIWSHRSIILEYLAGRVAEVRSEAIAEGEAVKRVTDALDVDIGDPVNITPRQQLKLDMVDG